MHMQQTTHTTPGPAGGSPSTESESYQFLFILPGLMTLSPAPLQTGHGLPTIFLITLLLFILDTASTKICLDTGKMREANPIMRKIALDPFRMMIAKMAALFILMYSCYYNRDSPALQGLSVTLILLITSAAITNNVTWYIKKIVLGR